MPESRLRLALLAVAALVGFAPVLSGQWHYLSGGSFNGVSSVGDRVWVAGQDGLFFQSYDNGANWFQVPRFTARNLLDVEFWDGNNGLLLGTGKMVFRTTNAGATWDSAYLPTDSRYLKFVSRDVVWATGGSDDPSVSVDGGLSWQRRTGGRRASFIDSLNGWQTADEGDRRFIEIMRTTDGGRSWVLAGRIDTGIDIQDGTWVQLLYFSSATRGICTWYTFFGRNSSRSDTHITTDGGATWHSLGCWGSFHADHTADELILALHRTGCCRISDVAGYVEFGRDQKLNDVSASRGNSLWVCGNGGRVFSSYSSGRSWQNARLSVGNLVKKTMFFDTAVGLALGERTVYRTTDAGRTWMAVLSSQSNAGTGFADLAIPGPNRALVSYDDILFSGYEDEAKGFIRIYRTEDAGRTWSATHSRYLVTRGYAPYAQGLAFSDSIHGWHPGVAPGENSIKTTDGGATWLDMPSVTWGLDRSLKPSFPVVDTGWVASSLSGKIWRTNDGGGSWDAVSSTGATCILMRDTQSGWKVTSSILWRTSDGGVNWSTVPGSAGVSSVTFVSEAHGACVGTGGFVLRTSDGGETWVQDSVGFTSGLSTVFMLDSARAWAAGENGLVLGLGDWASGLSESSPPLRTARLHQLTVRPNPCRDRVILEIDRASSLELELRDVAGRQVRRLAVPAGSRGVNVDLRGLPAGVYFVGLPRDGVGDPVRLVKVE